MTSQKSLNYKNVSPFALRNALRSGVLPFLAYTAFMTFIFPILNFICLYDEKMYINSNNMFGSNETITHLNQKYIYSVLQDAADVSISINIATLVAGVLMGISIFKFITSKKSVNVYYSLGITRTNLFLARYFAGIVLLFAAIAVPVAVSCAISIGFIGFTVQALTSAAYMIFAVFTLAVLTFSVTAAVMAAVGTSIEGAGFTAIIMLIPTGFFYMLQLLAQVVLYGNPFKLGYYFNYSKDYESISLAMEYAKFNPILFIDSMFEDDLIGCMKVSQEAEKLTVSNYMHPLTGVAWMIVAIAVTVLAIVIYNRRKAEICGFFGACKTLNFMAAFVAGILAFTVSTAAFYEQTKALSIIVSIVTMALSYIIINLIFTRSFKKTFRSIYLLGAEYIAAIIILTIFVTGGFGYSSKIPTLSQIKSVEISTVAYETLLTDDDVYVYSHYHDEYAAFTETLSDTTIGLYTSPDDVQKILTLHSKLIQLGSADKNSLYNTSIIIRYQLEDGSDFCRYYEHADLEALRLNLELYETDFLKDKLDDTYINEYGGSNDYFDYGYSYNMGMLYENTKIVAVNPSLKTSAFKYLDLDEAQFNALKKAVVNDLKSLSSEQYYTPDKPAIGALVFRPVHNLYTYSETEQKEVVIEETDLINYVFNTDNMSSESTVFLTPDMTETLSFLEQSGLMDYFAPISADEVESISFLPAVIDKNSSFYEMGIAYTLDFYAANEHVWNYGDTAMNEEIANQNTVKDEQQIAEILQKAHLKYYTGDSGYICRIKYKSGETVRKYISQQDAPDFVKNYEYIIGIGEDYTAVNNDIAVIGGADGPTAIIVAETVE